MRYMIVLLLATGCASADYYYSDRYKIKKRQKASLEMMEETHMARKKCAPRSGRPRKSKRRRKYYY